MNPHHSHVNTLSTMDSFKINIDAETQEFCLKIPFSAIKDLLKEDQTITVPPDTLKQAYYFQHKAEDKENFSLNAGIQDKYEQEEYDQEFWDDYHNNHSVEEEVSFISETGIIDESGEKTITSKEELKNTAKETFGQENYSSETQGS